MKIRISQYRVTNLQTEHAVFLWKMLTSSDDELVVRLLLYIFQDVSGILSSCWGLLPA